MAISPLRGIRIARRGSLQGIFTLQGSWRVRTERTQQFPIIQMQHGVMVEFWRWHVTGNSIAASL